jgi:predicted dehydrogenase
MINLGIAGLGGWGKNLVNAIQGKSDNIQFVAAANRTPAKVADFCQEKNIRLSDDVSSILDDAEINAVVVAGPSQLHAEIAMAALEADKHVMVIKPLALFKKDAEALRQAAEQRGLVLALGYDRCFHPASDELRKCVADGKLGKIIHAEGNFCVDRYRGLPEGDWKGSDENSQPGSLTDHMLYRMIELLGPVESLTVQASRHAATEEISDTAAVALKFASGISGHLTAIGVTPVFHRLHLFGTEGWAEIRNDRRYEFKPLKGDGTVIEFDVVDALNAQLEAFAAAINGERTFPVTPEDAVASVAALEAMGRSAKSGQTEIV